MRISDWSSDVCSSDLPATMNVREQVGALVARAAAAGHRMGLPNSWTAADPAFSRMLGAAGLLGITWPRKYGGGERSALERYVVLEELLAAGAPVDRKSTRLNSSH